MENIAVVHNLTDPIISLLSTDHEVIGVKVNEDNSIEKEIYWGCTDTLSRIRNIGRVIGTIRKRGAVV